MNKIILINGGSLSDIMFNYLHPGFESNFVASLKREAPKVRVKAKIYTNNPAVMPVFAMNPNLDEVVFNSLDLDFAKATADLQGYKRLAETHYATRAICETPEIFVTQDEESQIEDILSLGPLATLHAFSGVEGHSWQRHLAIEPAIEALLDHGYNVALLGGTHFNICHGRLLRFEEEFSYRHSQVFNLVNLASLSLQMRLTWYSSVFIGTYSVFSRIAALSNTRSLVLTSRSVKDSLDSTLFDFRGTLSRAGARVLAWDEVKGVDVATTAFLDDLG